MTETNASLHVGTSCWRNVRLATLREDQPGLGWCERGAMIVRQGRIAYAGPEADADPSILRAADAIDGGGRLVTPALIDCHTHLVHGGDRAREFEMRLAGASYEEIARAGAASCRRSARRTP